LRFDAFWCVLAVLFGRSDTRRNLLKNITTIFFQQKTIKKCELRQKPSFEVLHIVLHASYELCRPHQQLHSWCCKTRFIPRQGDRAAPTIGEQKFKEKVERHWYLLKFTKDKLVKIRCCLSNSFSWLLSVPFSNEAGKEGERERKMSAEPTATRTQQQGQHQGRTMYQDAKIQHFARSTKLSLEGNGVKSSLKYYIQMYTVWYVYIYTHTHIFENQNDNIIYVQISFI
jgi:hypothetical protein